MNISHTMTKTAARMISGAFLMIAVLIALPSPAQAFSLRDVVDPFGVFDSGGSSSGGSSRPALVVSCTANATQGTTRDRIVWSASASGGTGKYTYTWSGSENLSGTDRSVSKNYTFEGYKDGTVTVKSGSAKKTVQCGTSPYIREVNDNNDDDDDNDGGSLRVSCSVDDETIEVGERVTWSADVSGGSGSYDYDWDGDDGLHGDDDEVSKRYYDTGIKEASVTVRTSGGDRKTVDCKDEVRVRDENGNDDDDYDDDDDYNYGGSIGGNCYATPTYATVGEPVRWTASVWGGNGNYTYDWNGDGGLDGRGSSITYQYRTAGNMNASVRVKSGSRTAVLNCANTIDVTGGTILIPNNQSLSFSCSANVGTARIGTNVTWSANVIGGNGNYIYSWTGTDGITSSGPTMSGFYDGTGTKYAYLTVRSGSQTATKACGSVNITNAAVVAPRPTGTGTAATLEAVCYPSVEAAQKGESVLWTVEANGGNGTYTYSWTGADGLRGTQPVVVKSYKADGAKFAVVTVKSGSQSVTQACDTITNVGASSVFGANALFGINGISWGFIGFLILLLLVLVIGYVLYNKSKI